MYFLQKRCEVLRCETDWARLVSLGPNKLVGTELEAIVLACHFMADDFSAEFYGKCNSASLIIDYLHEYNADLTSNNGGWNESTISN